MRLAFIAAVSISLTGHRLPGQNLTGHWVYEENGQTVELDVRHDRSTGRATGTFSMFGNAAPFEGTVTDGTLVIQRLGDVKASAENGVITARVQTGSLLVTVSQPGQAPVTVPMTRRGDPTSTLTPQSGGRDNAPAPTGAGFRAGTVNDFAGKWQFHSPDGTSEEVVDLVARGSEVTGQIAAFEHGYFSGRTTEKARVLVRGTVSNGGLELRVWSADGSPNASTAVTGRLRGEYLILRNGENETGYARPGRSLVQKAEGSPDAAALARAIDGRVYSRSRQAGGRGGAIAGDRVRLALCGNGAIEYDVSDVGSVRDGGGSMGSTLSRRGTWNVVLYAGAPAVEAHWQGTGTSYSLTRYFRIRPDAAGRSANVDGDDLPLAGRC
jgi:hypothetical protein